MTRVPTLHPGESIVTAAADVSSDRIEIEIAVWNPADDRLVMREGGPWQGDDTFAAFQQHVHQQIAQAFGITPVHQGRKTCLSCGAIQTSAGDLPCDH